MAVPFSTETVTEEGENAVDCDFRRRLCVVVVVVFDLLAACVELFPLFPPEVSTSSPTTTPAMTSNAINPAMTRRPVEGPCLGGLRPGGAGRRPVGIDAALGRIWMRGGGAIVPGSVAPC